MLFNEKYHAKETSNMRSCLCLLFAVLFLAMSSSAFSAELTVRTFERGGKAPLQGVAVCLGTSARLNQFGASLTDDEGYVVFSGVPRTSLVVTVSRPGYMGEQEHMSGSDEDRMLVLSLPTGGGGVECLLGQDEVEIKGATLDIESFQLGNGAAVTRDVSVTLDNKLSGIATHYRASERPDFQGAEWLTFEKKPRFQLSAGQGNKTVYFQVRRYARINGADIEARSSVMSDSINVQN
jgi:hypothetical protein